jgi:hypothetical protein
VAKDPIKVLLVPRALEEGKEFSDCRFQISDLHLLSRPTTVRWSAAGELARMLLYISLVNCLWSFFPGVSHQMYGVLSDLIGLLLIMAGSVWGMAFGSLLFGRLGGLLGLITGALWGFQLAEGFALLVKIQQDRCLEPAEESGTTCFSQPHETPSSPNKRTWLARVFGRKSAQPAHLESYETLSLEDIHQRLKEINSELWRQLRIGVLSSCHAGLYSVRVDDDGKSLDWREVNRRAVASLHRFETATNDEERSLSLQESLDRIGQKLLLAQKAALRKADRLNTEEEKEIRGKEAELWRLSRILRAPSSSA